MTTNSILVDGVSKIKKYEREHWGPVLTDWVDQHGYKCGICGCGPPGPGQGRDLNADHNHKTHQFRGLLCHNCNLGLGHFKDSPARLLRALRYLQENQEYLSA